MLGRWFEFVPVCPEMEIGMGTPRPTVPLVEDAGKIRLVAPSTGEGFTERMLDPYIESDVGAGRGLLEALAARACVVVMDDYPAFFLPRMAAAAVGAPAGGG